MAIRLTTTAESTDYVKCLVYGDSGVGKTWLCKTAPSPVIISAEKGLLTLKDMKIPVIEISSFSDLEDALKFVTEDKRAQKFKTICLDSISDIAETVLAEEKENCGADPRQAYGAYADKLLPLIKKFRDIEGRHVYFTAKLRRIVDEFAKITYFGPMMPGQQLGPQLPYMFDFCLALRIGQTDEGENFRYIQTVADIQYTAKSRGDNLEETEPPDLAALFEKALADGKPEPEPEVIETDEAELETEGSFEEPADEQVEESETASEEVEAVEEDQQEVEEDQDEKDLEVEGSFDGSEENTEDESSEESMEDAAEAAMLNEGE